MESKLIQEFTKPVLERDHDEWVIPNSDALYKKDIKWVDDVEPIEPNEYEKKMLEGTIKPLELLQREQEEKPPELTPEEDKKEKTKQFMSMFKVISLDEMGYKPFHDPKTFNPKQMNEYMMLMKVRVQEYDDGKEIEIKERFYKICNDKIFYPTADVSLYSCGR